MLGTKWLKFWTYAGLPGVGLVALLLSFQLPRFGYEILPIAILCAAVAFGLHKRKLWGWQWNWVVVTVVYLVLLVPLPIREAHGGFAEFLARGAVNLLSMRWTQDRPGDLLVPLATRLILVSILWLLPNWLYWKKRRGIFS